MLILQVNNIKPSIYLWKVKKTYLAFSCIHLSKSCEKNWKNTNQNEENRKNQTLKNQVSLGLIYMCDGRNLWLDGSTQCKYFMVKKGLAHKLRGLRIGRVNVTKDMRKTCKHCLLKKQQAGQGVRARQVRWDRKQCVHARDSKFCL